MDNCIARSVCTYEQSDFALQNPQSTFNVPYARIRVNMRQKIYRSNGRIMENLNLSHNNPCFQCDIAITNFLVSHTCEIRFHDVIGRTIHVHVYVFLRKNSKTWLTYIDLYVLDPYFLIRFVLFRYVIKESDIRCLLL